MNPEDELTETEVCDEENQEAPAKIAPPLFVVDTVLNAEMQLEASNAVASKAPRYVGYAAFGLSVLALIFMIYRIITTHGGKQEILLTVVLVLTLSYLIYSRVTMPKKAMLRWEEGLQRSFGCTQLHLCTEFYDKALAQTVQEDDSLITEGYSALTELRETEHLLLLRQSSRQWFFLAKDGFRVGTVEAFQTFISQKLGG